MNQADHRVKLIHDAFASFAEGDKLAGLGDFLHPEVVCRVLPPLLNTGTWQGQAGFVQMTQGWEEAFGGIDYGLQGVELVDDLNVLVFVHQQATGAESGVPVALDVYFLIEFEGERAVRFEVHANRDSALGAI